MDGPTLEWPFTQDTYWNRGPASKNHHKCSRKNGSRCLDSISSDLLTGIPSDFLKEFTLLRILLGIVKAAPSPICQTVEFLFDETSAYTNQHVTDILAYRLRQKLRDSLVFPSFRTSDLTWKPNLGIWNIVRTVKRFLSFSIMDNCWIYLLRKRIISKFYHARHMWHSFRLEIVFLSLIVINNTPINLISIMNFIGRWICSIYPFLGYLPSTPITKQLHESLNFHPNRRSHVRNFTFSRRNSNSFHPQRYSRRYFDLNNSHFAFISNHLSTYSKRKAVDVPMHDHEGASRTPAPFPAARGPLSTRRQSRSVETYRSPVAILPTPS